jgi:hypothetical protein
MGTRADFYTKESESLVWHGSIAWDGYPSGIDDAVKSATTQAAYLDGLASFFKDRDDTTLPADGWPWPWEDSRTTDYAYIFDGDRVAAYCFGRGPFDPTKEQSEEDEGEEEQEKVTIFPNMKDKASVTYGKRSGLMILSVPR